ncbi:1877_t:CDS:1, partial [Acaulospora colombiana]
LSIESSVRDHVNNTKRTFIQQASLPNLSSGNNSARDVWLSYPVERAESIVARLISPSGRRTAILKETNATPKKRF